MILNNIETVAPIDIQRWKHINPYFLDVYIELTYILIQNISIDDFTTRHIYRRLLQQQPRHVPRTELQNLQYNWRMIYDTLFSIFSISKGFEIWYQIVHNIYPTNARLKTLGIREDDRCLLCNQPDDIEHLITKCNFNAYIWKKYTRTIALLLHTSAPNVRFQDLIVFPEYRYFPPRKKKL